MPRARNIKPAFFANEKLVDLPFQYRLLFIGLWTLADRAGRLEDRPKRVRMEVFPADDVDCDAGLTALHDAGFIVRYELDGKRYIEIPSFARHQNPHHKERESTIPPRVREACAAPSASVSMGLHDLAAEDLPGSMTSSKPGKATLNPDTGILNPDRGIQKPESGGGAANSHRRAERFPEFWMAWPRNDRKQDKGKCEARWKSKQLDAVADEILKDLAIKATTDKWQNGYVEAPLVYLTGERWKDGVTPNQAIDFEKLVREVEEQDARRRAYQQLEEPAVGSVRQNTQ